MKTLCSFIVLLMAIFFGSSCQKEFSFEGGSAKGLLEKGPAGDCLPVTVSGNYKKDSLLKAATNYVDITVNISKPGSYFIKTDTLNGYSFSAAGVFTVAGLNQVRLLASGRPIAGTLDIFTVRFDTSMCQFSVLVLGGGASTQPATFLFNCALAQSSGTYRQGLPTTAANMITMPVTVINAGSYNITTSNNGVQFSGSGILSSSASPQTITLYASLNNVPIAEGGFIYTVNAGGTTCVVSINYSAGSFNATDSIVATIDSVYTTFKIRDSAKLDNTSLSGYAGINIKAVNNTAADETFSMAIARAGSSIAAGTYTINNFPASINATKYTTATGIFAAAANPGTVQNFGFNIIITSVTATKVIGTFSGRLRENGTGPLYKTITNGIFSVTIYP